MHNRIFVISREFTEEKGLFPWEEPGTVAMLRVDYIVPSEDFIDDIEWLQDAYGIKVFKERNKYFIPSNEIKILKDSLEKIKNERLEKVAEELKKERPSLWRIAYRAWNQYGFFFYMNSTIWNEMELLEYLERGIPKRLFILESYDYHY